MVYSNTLVGVVSLFVWTFIPVTCSQSVGCFPQDDFYIFGRKCSNMTLNPDSVQQTLQINKDSTNATVLSFSECDGNFDSKPFQNFTDLKILVLTDNDFEKFHLKSELIEYLFMVRTTVPEGSTLANCCSRLEKLSLKFNKGFRFENEGFKGLKRLRNLDVTLQNVKHITKDTFGGLHKLRTLSIINCSVESIAEGSFDDLYNLRELYIEDNSLRRIDENVLRPLTQLTSLIIYGDSLPSLALSMFTGQNKLMQIGLPLDTWSTIDVEEIPSMFPKLNFFSYIGQWKSDENGENMKKRVFKKLTRLLLTRDRDI